MNNLIKISVDNFPVYQDRIMEIECLSFLSPWSLHSFQTELTKSVSHLWGLVNGNILLGYICFWMFASEIQLINIAVHPANRRGGVGCLLLDKMISIGFDKGMHHIWLEVRPSNSSARKLYKKTGFMEVGLRYNYYTDTKEDAIIMDLELSNGKNLTIDYIKQRQLSLCNY